MGPGSAALVGGVAAVGAVVAAPYALAVIGFTKAGILAGSIAAKLMSWAAISNGGGVAAGSLVAFFQSLGAAGVSAATTVAVGGIGAAVGWLIKIFG
ncbi:interferon alpha-inducible protein 27-like protein 2A [Mastacembelus armatus]|uniref:interferon alpha-inducible protein 27-like protein 2A n=1 Tax=Mastacembelus armatus TaxID=205130 RepID=UPI000E4541FE|nr:interferon alpha-inducible protein 27-like protein 2A [Mastacembelus armatus]